MFINYHIYYSLTHLDGLSFGVSYVGTTPIRLRNDEYPWRGRGPLKLETCTRSKCLLKSLQDIFDPIRIIDTHYGVGIYSTKKNCYMVSTRSKMVRAKETGVGPSSANTTALLEAQMQMKRQFIEFKKRSEEEMNALGRRRKSLIM